MCCYANVEGVFLGSYHHGDEWSISLVWEQLCENIYIAVLIQQLLCYANAIKALLPISTLTFTEHLVKASQVSTSKNI